MESRVYILYMTHIYLRACLQANIYASVMKWSFQKGPFFFNKNLLITVFLIIEKERKLVMIIKRKKTKTKKKRKKAKQQKTTKHVNKL